MSRVIDQPVREALLNPQESFIVQAPAGSGKTELLTQRILALLAVVDKPENILAITFTKKAAAEMRHRVVSALMLGQQSEPAAAHEKFRWHLARKVLQREKQKQWNLLHNPARLNITTIDSLSANLSSALPLLSQTGALPAIQEDATRYYQLAIESLLAGISDADETAGHIKQLLTHKDNNLDQITALLAQMLGKRLQWLAPLQHHVRQFDSALLIESLQQVTESTLKRLYQSMPLDVVSEIPELLNFASSHLKQNPKNNKLLVSELSEVGPIKPPVAADIGIWQAVAELFLKKSAKAEVLKSFTITSGFPAASAASNQEQKAVFNQMKTLAQEIAGVINETPGAAELLFQVSLLPGDIESAAMQPSLHSVLDILPKAVAHLKLVFSQYNIIDFPELALASLDALGHPDMPTDKALALDYQLEHILIDEFQDTSSPQIQLIELLTSGWQPDSQKSLFLVGDPMQSIYRFRDANVSLFMQITKGGLGDIPLKFERLQVNFRSSATIVDWVNQQFSRIMPTDNDLTLSAVSYAPSVAFNPAGDLSRVESYITLDAEDHRRQAEQMLALVQAHLESNRQLAESNSSGTANKTLAILARSRSHFSEIVALLNQAAIDFEAIEIDRLSDKMVVKDLTSLAFALCDQFDELSWAACMRSPWFGLSLPAIKQVLTNTSVHLTMPARLTAAMPEMDLESKTRCEKVLPLLQSAISFKAKKPFRKWLLGCYEAVGGLSHLDYEADRDDLLACLDKLSELSVGGELNDRRLVNEAIEKLYAAPNPNADGQVQVMTIHKSKGLEFDTVILPRLDSFNAGTDQDLLKWTEVVDEFGRKNNLLAISKETGKETDDVYRYINYLDKQKSHYESQRVLYVAATRAKEKLYLLGNVKSDPKQADGYKPPVQGSYLGMLWSGIEGQVNWLNRPMTSAKEDSLTPALQQSIYQSRWVKLSNIERIQNMPSPQTKLPLIDSLETEYASQELKQTSAELSDSASIIGTVMHRQLEWLSHHWEESFRLPDNWPELTRSQLKQKGLHDESELAVATEKVLYAINKVLASEFGQFTLSNKQSHASEVVLHKKLEQGNFLTRIIDRTFIQSIDDKKVRWIIDYKSSQPESGESVEAFIQRESNAYLDQLKDYFNMYLTLEEHSIKAGLYFPMLDHFELLLSVER